ncbi:MAG TPA: c-type cytochrome [Terriglobia bacterium]|nr:c-type cytochrome [Terriglobia bacterium]
MHRTREIGTAAVLICSAILLASCSAHRKPTTVERALANSVKDVIIPIEATNLKNPVPSTPESIQRGSETFGRSCALCHSTDGHADSQLGTAMYPPAMDLTSPHVRHWSEADLFWIIQNGVSLTGMPSWKSILTTDQTWELVNFIKALPEIGPGLETQIASSQKPSYKTHAQLIAYGKTLYRQEGCFACHKLDGQGGTIGPDLSIEGTRGRSSEWLVGHFKDPPKFTPGSVMPSFKNLTPEQLEALTVFLVSQKGS